MDAAWRALPLPLAPWDIAIDRVSGDAIVVDRFRRAATRITVDGDRVWDTGKLAHSPCAVGVDARGHVYVATHLGGKVEVLDAATGGRVASVDSPALTVGLVLVGGDVATVGSTVTWLERRRAIALPSAATSAAAVAGAVWCGLRGAVAIVHDDEVDVVSLGTGPQVVGRGGRWVADHREGRCRLLDDRGAVVADIGVPGHPWHVVRGGELVVVVSPEEGIVTVLDAATHAPIGEAPVSRPWAVAYDDERGTLWITCPLEGVVRVAAVPPSRRRRSVG